MQWADEDLGITGGGDPRNLVEKAVALDVAALGRAGHLKTGEVTEGEVTLMALASGETVRVSYIADLTSPDSMDIGLVFESRGELRDQIVRIEATSPTYGGRRLWFLCHATGKRARCLYLPPGAECFASREVHGLVYRSQGESASVRDLRRQQKIRVRLGGDPSIYAPFPRRPYRMRKLTYTRLQAEALFGREALEQFPLAHSASRPRKVLPVQGGN